MSIVDGVAFAKTYFGSAHVLPAELFILMPLKVAVMFYGRVWLVDFKQ